jgi:hypothetical protein
MFLHFGAMKIGKLYLNFFLIMGFYSILLYSSAESRNSIGGTAKQRVLEQIEEVRKRTSKYISETS